MTQRIAVLLLLAATCSPRLRPRASAAPKPLAGPPSLVLRLEQELREHSLRSAGFTRRPADRHDADQLRLGRFEFPTRTTRPPVHAQLSRRWHLGRTSGRRPFGRATRRNSASTTSARRGSTANGYFDSFVVST